MGAKAISSIVGPKSVATAIVVGPMPKRFEMRVAVSAAASDPMAPIERTRPMRPGDSSSSRMRNTRMIENATLEKRFEVAVHPA